MAKPAPRPFRNHRNNDYKGSARMKNDDRFSGVTRLVPWALVVGFVLLLWMVLTTGLRPPA